MGQGVFTNVARGFKVIYYSNASGFTSPTWTDSSGDGYSSTVTPGNVPPCVTTPASRSITSTTAILGGDVTSNGGATVTALGVVYAPADTNSYPQIGGTGVTKVTGKGTSGVFVINVSGLTQGKAYSFAAYATNSVGTAYSVTGSFIAGGPSVTSPTCSSVTSTTATLGGDVISNGGNSVTAHGVVYVLTSINTPPQIGGTDVTNVIGTGNSGVFTVNVPGLAPNTSYTFAAYATNSQGTDYSETGTFTTPASSP